MWGRRIKERGCGLWATPCANDYRGGVAWKGKKTGRLKDEVLWPTPTVCGNYNRKGASASSGDGLLTAVIKKEIKALWPTLLASGWGNEGSRKMLSRLVEQGEITDSEKRKMQQGNGGQLNPEFVEWLMGFPRNWTDLDYDDVEGDIDYETFWDSEFDNCPRVLQNVKNRAAKIKCLGNAIVPAIARLIFEEIKIWIETDLKAF